MFPQPQPDFYYDGANEHLLGAVPARAKRILEVGCARGRLGLELKEQDAHDVGLSIPELFDLKERSGLFSESSGAFPINANITEIDEPDRQVLVSAEEDGGHLADQPDQPAGGEQ